MIEVTRTPSRFIPKYVIYDHAKFIDDPSTLAKEDACLVRQSGAKREFSSTSSHFSGPIFLPKMRLLNEINPFQVSLIFPLLFNQLLVFIVFF